MVFSCSVNSLIFGAHGSDAFEDFMQLLGKKIVLKGFKGYRGGLDVRGTYFHDKWSDNLQVIQRELILITLLIKILKLCSTYQLSCLIKKKTSRR